MLGCYRAARRYLTLIGTEHLAELQPALRIDFLHPTRHHDRLACARLPVPFHLFSGLLGLKALPLNDRLAMLRVAKEILYTSSAKERELDRKSVEEWLGDLKQTALAKTYLWNVITVGAMNNAPGKVSALMLFRVLRAAFLERRDNASLFIPRVGLSELFVDPAIRFIEARGGVVQMGAGVRTLLVDGATVHSVHTADQREFQAKAFISAVPWYAFEGLFPAGVKTTWRSLEQTPGEYRKSPFISSPIISVHVWLDKEITDLDFAAMLETRMQWMFNKSKILLDGGCGPGIRQYLSLVISGAEEFIDLPKEQLVKIAMEDIRSVFPRAHEVQVVHSLVVKEKRATFVPSPGLDGIRPGATTQFQNLFLAGDWTATGYPATIEGAVASGKNAADFIT